MKQFFTNQGYHLGAFLAVGALLYLAGATLPGGERPLWGLAVRDWVLVSWGLAGLHQGWVLFFWRMELHFGKISAWLGRGGFLVYRIGFVLVAGARLLLLIPISHATARTAAIPDTLAVGLIVATTPPILWGLHSVLFRFGLNRAFGADHFDPAFRGALLETRGIFRYVPNAMYTVVLLAIYHPGLLWHSGLGLVAAAAHHALVWCHYFCTERPDMREIYGPRTA